VNNQLSAAEKRHIAMVKEMPCGVCGAPGPSEAHHIVQGQQYTVINLCPDCHRDPLLGWHGQKRMWAIHKKNELSVLNDTIRRLLNAR